MLLPLALLLRYHLFCLTSHYLASSRAKQSFLFSNCDLVSIAITCNPGGRCVPRPAVSTLFTFCPPGPDERQVSSFTSLGFHCISSFTSKAATPTNQFLRL